MNPNKTRRPPCRASASSRRTASGHQITLEIERCTGLSQDGYGRTRAARTQHARTHAHMSDLTLHAQTPHATRTHALTLHPTCDPTLPRKYKRRGTELVSACNT